MPTHRSAHHGIHSSHHHRTGTHAFNHHHNGTGAHAFHHNGIGTHAFHHNRTGGHFSTSHSHTAHEFQTMQAAALFQQASAGSIYVLTTTGQDSQCGFFCCKGDSVKCNFNPHFLPDEPNGIISFTEFATMTNEINQVLADTHCPMMPLIFTHFCIPFSPICVMMYCANQRIKRVGEVLEKYTVNLVERGYYWEPAPANSFGLGIAFLKMNKAAAERHQQADPSALEGSIAPSAVVACADPDEHYLGTQPPMATAQVIPSTQQPMKREY